MADKFEKFARDMAEFNTTPAGKALMATDPAMVLNILFEQALKLFPDPLPAVETKARSTFKPFAWLKHVVVAPTMPHAKGPKCYEQMHKLRFEWWATLAKGDDIVETGPYADEAAARRACG